MNVTVTNKAATLELFAKFPETTDITTLRKALYSKPRFGSLDSKDVIYNGPIISDQNSKKYREHGKTQ